MPLPEHNYYEHISDVRVLADLLVSKANAFAEAAVQEVQGHPDAAQCRADEIVHLVERLDEAVTEHFRAAWRAGK